MKNLVSAVPAVAIKLKEHQNHWDKLCRDPNLSDLPYKTETNRRGQLILTPISVSRSTRMSSVMRGLDSCAPGGRSLPSFAIVTPAGVKVPDVVWASGGRLAEMKKTGDPTTLAPEICIEVMSEPGGWEEMEEKRVLYREAGAEEVWVVDEEGDVRFFADGELEESRLAEGFPNEL